MRADYKFGGKLDGTVVTVRPEDQPRRSWVMAGKGLNFWGVIVEVFRGEDGDRYFEMLPNFLAQAQEDCSPPRLPSHSNLR